MFNRNWTVRRNADKYFDYAQGSSWIVQAASIPCLQYTKSDGSKIKEYKASVTNDIFLGRSICSYGIYTGAQNNSVYNLNSYSSNSSYSYNKLLVINFGSGNTEPTIDDYDLEKEYKYTTNLRQLEIQFSREYNNNTLTLKKILKGRYVAITDMTIKELGLSAGCDYTRILISRDVLSEPLVVTAGQTFSVTLTIEEKLEDLGEEVTSVSAEIE